MNRDTSRSMNRRLAWGFASCWLLLGAAACGGGSSSSPTPSPPPPPSPPTGDVTISGQITFDRVPLNTVTNGLDYTAIRSEPARGVVVEAVDSGGAILATDTTNAQGSYQVQVNPNTNVRIRARAQLLQRQGATWDVTVRDNTSSDAPYVLAGGLGSSGTTNSVRNLNAGSGWNNTSRTYATTRAAAPFAILGSIYEALQDFSAVDGSVSFPTLQVFWSVNNRQVSGDVTAGEIGTSSYTRISNVPTILVLGAENDDTDEYDSHVIVHEFGHYFEDQLSRSDSIGGPHSLSNRLDPRVAFGEGWGNALSGIVLGDPIYRDSSGSEQSVGFAFSVESNNTANAGWYREFSTQSILFDIADTASDGADSISAGLAPLYRTLTDPRYTGTPAFTTIFSFIDILDDDPAISVSALNSLVAAQSINGTGAFGAGETNAGGVPSSLPIYNLVTVGGPSVQICSVDDFGTENKLGNFEYLRFTAPTRASYTFTMTRVAGGATNRDPDFRIWQAGRLIAIAGALPAETEVLTRTLDAGEYVIDAFDAQNTEEGQTPGDACYDFMVQ